MSCNVCDEPCPYCDADEPTAGHCDWVFVRSVGDHYKIDCERCPGELRVLLPVPIQDFCDAMKGFGDRHRHCEPTLKSERLLLLRALRRRAKPEGGSFTISLGL